MQRIKDYEELSKLIFSHLKKNVQTNTFLSKEEFESEIEFGNLFYFDTDIGLFLLREREEYYILNYYIYGSFGSLIDESSAINLKECKEKILVELKNLNRPAVVEVVGKKAMISNYNYVVKFFEKLGMKEIVSRIRLSKETQLVEFPKESNVQIEKATIEEIAEIMNTFRMNFDKFYGCIPTEEILKKEIENIYLAKEAENIVGLLHKKEAKNASEIRHLAVNEEHRNKGIAKALLKKYLIDAKDFDNKTVWTAENNIIAQKVYEHFGYKQDEYISKVLKTN